MSRPSTLSIKDLAAAAAAGRENALQERAVVELDREESTAVNGGALAPIGTIGTTTTGYVAPDPTIGTLSR